MRLLSHIAFISKAKIDHWSIFALEMKPWGWFSFSRKIASSSLVKKKKRLIYIDLLKGFKKIILTRDYKERVNSYNLFQHETGRNRGAKNATEQDDERYHKLWLKREDTFHVTFNDMIKKNVSLINELQNFLFDEIKYDSLIAITQAISKPSITKSSKR